MLRLYYAPGSSSLASHIALEEAGAKYDTTLIDVRGGQQRSAEFLAVNPKGKVPALVTDRGTLTENPAILAYVAQSHPAAGLADLRDPYTFAELQAFNMFLATTVHLYFGQVYRPTRHAEGETAAAALKARANEALDAAFALVDQRLADGRAYVHGGRFTVSDCYLVVFERWFARGDAGHPAHFAHLQPHRQRVEQRPAVQRVLQAEGLT